MFKKINFYQLTITAIAVLFASAAVVYGWTAPSGGPPNNDVPPPINTGPTAQEKLGGLILGTGVSSTQNALVIPVGNFSIGTSTVKIKGALGGFINAQDVWLRDAASGTGAWASSLSGGGGGTSNLGQGTVPPTFGSNSSCYWVNPDFSRWHYDVCSPGYMVRGIYFWADNNWDQGNTLCCKIDLSLPTYCRNGKTVGQSTYGSWSSCNPPNACAPLFCIEMTNGLYSSTQTRTISTCQADGTVSSAVETLNCTGGPTYYCANTTRTDPESGQTVSNCYDPSSGGGG